MTGNTLVQYLNYDIDRVKVGITLTASENHDHQQVWRNPMLMWAILFFIIAIIAGVFGFGGIATASAGIAQILFFVFIVLFVIALIARAVRGRPPRV